MPQPLLLGVGLDQRHLILRTAREPEVSQRLLVHREDRHRRAVLGRHVPDGGPVRQRHGRHARPVELDELPHHAVLAEQLGHGQHQVGGGRTLRHLAHQPEPDHPGDEHRDGLAEHGRLGLDAADAPSQHAETVHHRRVRVGPHQRVRVRGAVAVHEDHLRQVLQVHLVADAGVRRDHPEVVERLLPPSQEPVPLLVAFELELRVALERVGPAHDVGDDRMVDDEVHGDPRIDPRRIATHVRHGVPHDGEVDHRRHAGEVLHQDAGRGERDLRIGFGPRVPTRQRLDVAGTDVHPVLVPQEVLQQHLQRVREVFDVEPLQRVQAVDLIRPVADGEARTGTEAAR